MKKSKIDKDIDKERLEYLYNVIAGLHDVKVNLVAKTQNEDEELPSSDIPSKSISLDKEKGFNRSKSEGLQELGHIWLSGSLKSIFSDWDKKRYGNFDDFRLIMNRLEDIRTESLMSVRYPQMRNRLINLHIEKLSEFIDENPEYIIKDPRAATYLLAENRFEIPIGIDESIKEVSTKIKDIIKKSKFWDENWKNSIKTGLKISETIKKWKDERVGPLFEKLTAAKQKAEEIKNEHKQFVEEEARQWKVIADIKDRLSKSNEKIKDFTKFLETLEKTKLPNSKDEDVRDIIKNHIEITEEFAKREIEREKENKKELKYTEELSKKLDDMIKDLVEKRYHPAIEDQTKIADEISKKTSGLEANIKIKVLPKTYLHFFEEVDEENESKGSSLTKEIIEEALKEEEKKKNGVGKDVMIKDGEERSKPSKENLPPIPGLFKMPPGTKVDKNLPKVKVTRFSDRYAGEGSYLIPNIRSALAMGYDIASALKRELKLKSVVLKDRMYGYVDMKAVKRQIARYGQIVDPKVMKIRRNLIEKHSVLVLVDFSGSMGGYVKGFAKVQHAKQALVTLGKTLETLNVNYSLRGFSATGYKFQICDILMKDFEDSHIDYTLINKVFFPSDEEDNCHNRDGSSVRHATKILQQQRGKKLLIVISDGLPSHPSDKDDYSGEFGEEDTKLAVREALESGVHIMGISIDPSANNFVLKAYPNSFVFNDMKMFPLQLTKTYIQAIMGKTVMR